MQRAKAETQEASRAGCAAQKGEQGPHVDAESIGPLALEDERAAAEAIARGDVRIDFDVGRDAAAVLALVDRRQRPQLQLRQAQAAEEQESKVPIGFFVSFFSSLPSYLLPFVVGLFQVLFVFRSRSTQRMLVSIPNAIPQPKGIYCPTIQKKIVPRSGEKVRVAAQQLRVVVHVANLRRQDDVLGV